MDIRGYHYYSRVCRPFVRVVCAGCPAGRAVDHSLKEPIEGFSVSSPQAGMHSHFGEADEHRLELLTNGLVFDLVGLAPGKAAPRSRCEHLVDLEGEADARAREPLEAITLVPGSHLRGGEVMTLVVQTMCWLGAQLSELPEVKALAWQPA